MKNYMKTTKPILICMSLLFVVSVMTVFSGCAKSDGDSDYRLYYLSREEDQLKSVGYDSDTTDRDTLIKELIEELKNPSESNLKSPGFDVSSLLGYSISAENNLTLNFDSEYLTLPHIKETLCRAAIVKTLCQIDGIEGIEFYVTGDPYADYTGQPIGFMTEETFVDNTSGETTYKQTIDATLYFADKSGKYLKKVPTKMTFDGTISMEKLVVDQLIKGPSEIRGVKEELKAVIPENTVVNQVTVKEKVCYIDMSKDFLEAVDGVKRILTLYSIINSLAELPDINKVQFTIDGESVRFFGDSDIPFDIPLERNLELVKE